MWPFRRPLWWMHRKLDELLMERPGFWGNLWRLFHRPDWQRSSKFNTRVWVVSFTVFVPLAHHFGHAWWVNLGVSVLVDTIAYVFHKEWVWASRQIELSRSAVISYAFTVTTFAVNLRISWELLNNTPFSDAQCKVMMGVMGVLVNPLIFKFRDRVALRDRSKAEA